MNELCQGRDYIDSIQNFYRVYSGINEKSADSVEQFLKTIISTKEYPLTRLGILMLQKWQKF